MEQHSRDAVSPIWCSMEFFVRTKGGNREMNCKFGLQNSSGNVKCDDGINTSQDVSERMAETDRTVPMARIKRNFEKGH